MDTCNEMNHVTTKPVIFIAAFGLIFCGFNMACNHILAGEQLPLVIEGDEQSKDILEKSFKEKPLGRMSNSRQDYDIRIVKPKKGLDYLILEVVPDPTVDYKIRIYDPRTRKEISNLPPEIKQEILRRLKKHHVN